MSSSEISDVQDAVQNEDSPYGDENLHLSNCSDVSNAVGINSIKVEESAVASKSCKSAKFRKNDHCIQQALRCLNRLSTPEEKFSAICAKYADLFDENRKFQASLKENQKQIAALGNEKDQTRSELMKVICAKDKLENLCRELQRQNREIKEESLQKIKDEEQKRKEVSSKFQATLNEITELMKQDSDKTMKLRDDNIDMTSKLKSIYEQYEIREQQIEKMAKQMALESQLYEAKIAKLEMETAAEKEVLLREKQQLLLTLTEYQARFQEYQNIELTLRNQVALYNDKYEEFEKSLTRSNEVFGGFKSEMENMSNKIVKLESETAAWKLRWEKTQKALIEMASEKQKSDHEVVLAAKQIATLHKLCRTLQTERAQLLSRQKHESSKNIDSNVVNQVDNLIEPKLNEENFELPKNSSAEKHGASKSKTKAKRLPVAEKSSSSIQLEEKVIKERSPSLTGAEVGEITHERNASESSIPAANIRNNSEENGSSENSHPVLVRESSVGENKESTSCPNNLILPRENCLTLDALTANQYNLPESKIEHTSVAGISDVSNESQDTVIEQKKSPIHASASSTTAVNYNGSSSLVHSNQEECVSDATKLNSRKKATQKKRNKK